MSGRGAVLRVDGKVFAIRLGNSESHGDLSNLEVLQALHDDIIAKGKGGDLSLLDAVKGLLTSQNEQHPDNN